jgi:hypothetical protein
MNVSRFTLITGQAFPETRSNITTLVADVSNSATVTVRDANNNIVCQLDAGDQATDYAHGPLNALYNTPTIAAGDALHVSAFFA